MNKGSTILNQLLRQISRFEFQKAISTYQVEKHAKGLSSWNQFCAMAFGQLTNQRSLKTIEAGLRSQGRKLYHHGIIKTSKSTLAYANEHRDYRAFQEIFSILLDKVKTIAPKNKLLLSKNLISIDATTIALCQTQFPWARFRKTKSGIKLLIKLNHDGHLPEHVQMTNAKEHELQSVQMIPFADDELVVFDRGFSNYQFFSRLYHNKVSFITRLKKNANYSIVGRNDAEEESILSDHKIVFTGYRAKKTCPMILRKIISIDQRTGKAVELLSNDHDLSAKTIADQYRERWQIEIFFKLMKQFLRIKRYYGNSRNAVMTQMFISLILYLLIQLQRFLSKNHIPFSTLIAVVQTNAFQKIDIQGLFERIFKPPDLKMRRISAQGVLF